MRHTLGRPLHGLRATTLHAPVAETWPHHLKPLSHLNTPFDLEAPLTCRGLLA
jgi:hypothetical protein